MSKYKLTFWQRIGLVFIWPIWFLTPSDQRKSWHEVKKGMEHHVCKFTIQLVHYGKLWLKCEHEGCNVIEFDDKVCGRCKYHNKHKLVCEHPNQISKPIRLKICSSFCEPCELYSEKNERSV